ncbi:MAG: hypothetical protein JNL62_20975 [Bryobacterales bacterium]|nr:hypothetical protein [Bryobacterales bacterium]
MLLRWMVLMMAAGCGFAQEPWRSTLYPEDWTPAFRDAEGRFLHDFSYAGYQRGEAAIPDGPGNGADRVVDAVAEYQADPTGASDSTAAIQAAIDAVGSTGGGVVFLPAGVYRVAPRGSDAFALWMKYDHVILRGAGAGVTFLHNTTPAMRGKEILRVAPLAGGSWTTVVANTTVPIVEDALEPTLQVKVRSTVSLREGDWVIVRSDASNEFIAEHQMTNWWTPARQTGPIFYRQVVGVNAESSTVTLDAPTRYALRVRDNARLYKTRAQVQGVGLEDFSIGNTESSLPGYGEEDYSRQGTGAYEVHGAHAIAFRQALFGWVRRVATFLPEGNTTEYHLVSNGVLLTQTRGITVEDCRFENPQYRGGGGNGYGFTLQGNENLLRRNTAVRQRHSFDFKSMSSSGNVIVECRSENPSLASDFHMHLSMANLLDGLTLNRDYVDATVRPYGTPDYHGVTTTQSVFWNTRGERYMANRPYLINSQQFGWGYVIGTRGEASVVRTRPFSFRYTSPVASTVDTSPEDFVEGVGKGDDLTPASLYEDQLARRLAR